jgi:methylmalonyl-CoA/ethylmalonyl-CoA epimerase
MRGELRAEPAETARWRVDATRNRAKNVGSVASPDVRVEGVHQVALRVEDLDRAEAFYRDVVGLRRLARFDPPGLVFFDAGGLRLLLEAGAPASLLYLRVDDLDAAWAELTAAGVQAEQEPHTIHRDEDGTFGPPGNEERMAFFRDSEGNLVGLVEQRLPR